MIGYVCAKCGADDSNHYPTCPLRKPSEPKVTEAVEHGTYMLNAWALRLADFLEGEPEEHQPCSHLAKIEEMIPRLKRERDEARADNERLQAERDKYKGRWRIAQDDRNAFERERDKARAQVAELVEVLRVAPNRHEPACEQRRVLGDPVGSVSIHADGVKVTGQPWQCLCWQAQRERVLAARAVEQREPRDADCDDVSRAILGTGTTPRRKGKR